jgi:hypothetical protein
MDEGIGRLEAGLLSDIRDLIACGTQGLGNRSRGRRSRVTTGSLFSETSGSSLRRPDRLRLGSGKAIANHGASSLFTVENQLSITALS